MKVSIVAQEVHSSARATYWQRLLIVVAPLSSLLGTFGVSPQSALAPTSVTLTSFTATAGDGGVKVRWVTSDEQNSWGFHLLGSANREAAHAQQVTGALIPATGGGTYSWLDRNPLPAGGYYSLEEIELDGTATLYGPVATAAVPSAPAGSTRILLPVVVR